MQVSRVFDMAPSFGMLVFILLQIPSPLRAAPNSLVTVQVQPEIRFLSMGKYCDFRISYQEDETELPTFEMTFEGDIVRRNASDPDHANAHIANPNMLWPGGVIEYKFYRTFPRWLKCGLNCIF